MAGYSGTPLPRKLGLRPGLTVALVRAPDGVRAVLAGALAACELRSAPPGHLDFLLGFADSRTDLERLAAQAAAELAPDGAFWAAWPKLTSGVPTDLREGVVREVGLSVGLVDVKVCAISETWSGLKFVRRRRDRPAAKALPDSSARRR